MLNLDKFQFCIVLLLIIDFGNAFSEHVYLLSNFSFNFNRICWVFSILYLF